MKVKVLSLFDGMACGMLAMKDAGLTVESYTAYEIDKYAVQTAQHNFPEIEECGDVFKADFSRHKGVDFLVGGSPCTFWSVAQSADKRETEASGFGWELFSQYVRALKQAQPTFFIYENNKSMSKAIRKSITDTFGFDAVCINSALVSAQNRQRLYWVGQRQPNGTYEPVFVPMPANEGVSLKEILESGCDLTMNDKAWTLTASYDGAVAWNTIERSQRNMVAEPVRTQEQNGNLSGFAEPTEFSGNKPIKALSCANGKLYDVHEVKNGILTLRDKDYATQLTDGFYIIRKLTIPECKRLQTVPDSYKFPVSNAQAYKMLGNGWTVKVISHLIHCCLEEVW